MSVWRALLVVVLLGAGCQEAERRDRLVALCAGHHAIPAAAVRALDDDDVEVLRALARDRAQAPWLRARAVTLAGARPSAATFALWREMRRAQEPELRIQAAWAEGLARRGAERAAFSAALLEDEDERLREVAAHLLATVAPEETERIARARLAVEPSAEVRAVLSRKVIARAPR